MSISAASCYKKLMRTEATLPIAVPPPAETTPLRSRLEFVDNLRWVMIVLVVSMHAAVTYSHVGSWYFMENPKPGTGVLAVFATYQILLQAFFMGLLFLLAGYFVPAAFDRKGPAAFLRDRAIRLGVPSLVYMLIIQPLTVYWLLRTFAEPDLPSLFHAYPGYLRSGRVLGGSGPMWFAVALLIFSCMYVVIRLVRHNGPAHRPGMPLPWNTQVLFLVLLMGTCSFLVRIIQPLGTNILNMQLCFFSQYILLFCVGIRARRQDWLMRIPYSFGIGWFKAALCGGIVAWVALLTAILKTHSESKLGGGLTWQSAAYSFWESFFCVGMCLGLIVFFRDNFNYQGKILRWLSDNSFAVYMFHTPLLIAVTLAMRGLDAPKLVKFLLATLFGLVLTYCASSALFRRTPLLKKVL